MKKILIILAVFISACATTETISWQTDVQEATISLPDQARKVTVLNRVRLAYPFSSTVKTTEPNPNVPYFMNGVISGFSNQVRNQQYLSIIKNVSQFSQNANGQFPALLSAAEVTQVALGSDILVSVDMMDQQMEDSYFVDIRKVSLGNNTYKEVDYFIGKRSLNVKVGIRLYHAKTGELLDEWSEQRDYFYEAESTIRARATSLLDANYTKELTALGTYYGRLYASRISPTAYIQSRQLYSQGNDYLVLGTQAAQRDNWEEAESQWSKGVKNETKRKKRAMLYHNLAINEDRQGNAEKAREYARKAADIHPIGVKTQSVVGF